MKILFFQTILAPTLGGVPRVTNILANELSKRGHECFYVFNEDDDANCPDKIKLFLSKEETYTNAKEKVIRFLKENEIDVMICQNAFIPIYIKILEYIRIEHPEKRIYTFLHASPDYWQSCFRLTPGIKDHNFLKTHFKNFAKRIIYPFYNPYINSTRKLYELSDRFVLLSESFKESFVNIYSVTGSQNKLLHLANPVTFSEKLPVYKITKKEKIAIVVSRLSEQQKKISTILKIWKSLSGTDHTDWKLWIIGSGPDEAYYKKIVREDKIANVMFFGHKENVREYYERASIFLMTSIWEGLPMSLLEAQQYGVVPIVFNNFSAVFDTITSGLNGFVIENNDADKFRETLSDLMQDEDMRNKLACNAISGMDKFSISNVVDQWQNTLLQTTTIAIV